MQRITERPADDEGAALVEYFLLVTLIAIVAMVTIGAFGGQLNDWYQTFVAPIT